MSGVPPETFAKLKAMPRKAAERTVDGHWATIARIRRVTRLLARS